jgi:uncharacterized protein (DUF1330 family)
LHFALDKPVTSGVYHIRVRRHAHTIVLHTVDDETRTPEHWMARGRKGCDMAKNGYWIGHVSITDPERYKDYIAANAAPLKKYGARYLVRNGASEVPEGGLGGRRHVVVEFDSYELAKACYHSPEYQAIIKLRTDASTADLLIIEGYEE